MPRRRNAGPAAAARQLAELGVAAPAVVGHRLARIAVAGPAPAARDRAEFTRMVVEKQVAFVQSWQAMFLAGLQAQQAFASAWLEAAAAAAAGRPAAAMSAAGKAAQASLAIAGAGLAPVHRKAVANARRLGRSRRR